MENKVGFEVEQALLGILMIKPALLSEIEGQVRFEDFHWTVHKEIFEAIEKMFRTSIACSPMTLAVMLAASPHLKAAGGKDYLVVLANAAGNTQSVKDYARTINNLSIGRRFLALCEEQARGLTPGVNVPITPVISEHIRQCEMVLKACANPEILTGREVTERIIAEMANPTLVTSTGLYKLDEAMEGGLHRGKAYAFAARKKIGKTILAGTISFKLNEMKKKHLFICGEMGSSEVHQRNLCRLLDMQPYIFRKGGEEIIERLRLNNKFYPDYTLYKDAPGLTFNDLKTMVYSAYHDGGIEGFILDYWQLVGGKDKNQSTAEHLEGIAQWIAEITKKLGIWAIVMVQLNQEGNTRGSEGVRLAFDQVYQICRKENMEPDIWLEMMDTRYTRWANIGSEDHPAFWLENKGPYFKQL